MQLLKLTAGTAECVLCPDIGGSIVSWQVDGQNMLRAADDAAIGSGDPLSLASFPLVPFSNRIAHGTFNWRGETITIQPNFTPEPHAIHGMGWKERWETFEVSGNHCVLTLNHEPDERWPWPFSAKQSITLGDNSLDMSLEAVNSFHEPVPLAFGHHPYFDQRDAYLAFAAARVLLWGIDDMLAYSAIPSGTFNFAKGERVEGHDIDHCYGGWDGEARIIWQGRPLGLVITSDMPAAVIYIPKGGDSFCFEPVPHMNDALNRPREEPAMPVVQPGESYRSTITMTAIAAEAI